MGAGKSIHKIDEAFHICGVDALTDEKHLKRLGIKCILNAAQDRLYTLTAVKPGEMALHELPKKFEVKIIGAEDCEDCNLSVHFQEIADFIEAGRGKGGVVVHCAAGISRASTSCMAYLMMKEHWTLEAAFRKVHAVRNIIHPNCGFWRQLRDLEASLIASGVVLKSLPADWQPPKQQLRPEEEEGKYSSTEEETKEILKSLDQEANMVESFITHFLTAKIIPKTGIKASKLMEAVVKLNTPGVNVKDCQCEGEVVVLRAGLVPSMTHDAFVKLLLGVSGVESAECE